MPLREEVAGAAHQRSQGPRGQGRWWLAVLVGCLLCVPFGWLLSYVAALPGLIGLFFFVLFGLVIGAIMHRTASRDRPYSPRILVAGTTVVVAIGSVLPIIVEAREHPADMAERALTKRTPLGDRTPEQYRADVALEVRRLLREQYPPGGVVGYVRWVMAVGEWKKGEIPGVTVAVGVEQRRLVWATRVVLSVALLGFGIGSQTFLLRLTRDPALRRKDERTEPESGNPGEHGAAA